MNKIVLNPLVILLIFNKKKTFLYCGEFKDLTKNMKLVLILIFNSEQLCMLLKTN